MLTTLGDDSSGDTSFGGVLVALGLVGAAVWWLGRGTQNGAVLSSSSTHAALAGAVPQASVWTPKKMKPSSRSKSVKVESRFEEDEEDDLNTASVLLDRPTLGALQKQIRSSGFKGAQVSGIAGSGGDGFQVHYEGKDYRFRIDETEEI